MELIPFPHVIIDGLFPVDVLRRVVAEFPAVDDPRWRRYAGVREFKSEGSRRDMWGPATCGVLDVLCSEPFRCSLADMFGMPPLEADTIGGGFHSIELGGFLGMHTDFNRHPVTGAHRRLNGLLYLNDGWVPGDGGALLLGVDRLVVEPTFGRFVAFATSDTSWHGHPDPWTNPTPRRSLAVYYYSATAPVEVTASHSTLWLE